MRTYAAHIVDNQVTEVIVGTAEWATDNLGGQWVDSPVKVGIGWTFHGDHFRPPQPYPSWIWDNGWQPPTPMPEEGMWTWDEETQTWTELPEDDTP
jgi:hypothetical protein